MFLRTLRVCLAKVTVAGTGDGAVDGDVDTDSKLSADGDPVSDPTLYHSLAGALQYLTFTRLDISYTVQQVCLYMHDPREPHFSALKRILRYIRDWAGCPTARRSTSGYCVFLGNNILSWSSKRQVTLSRSSAEVEYRSVANAVAETCWLRNLLRELHTPLSTATLVYCDNVSAVYLSSNLVQHQRTKHIEIDIHFVRDLVAAGHIRVLHVPSRYQYADIFTKGLPTVLFDEFRSSLSVRSSPAQTAGGLIGRLSITAVSCPCGIVKGRTVKAAVTLSANAPGNEEKEEEEEEEEEDEEEQRRQIHIAQKIKSVINKGAENNIIIVKDSVRSRILIVWHGLLEEMVKVDLVIYIGGKGRRRYRWVQGYRGSSNYGFDLLIMVRLFWNIEIIPSRRVLLGVDREIEHPAHILAYYSLAGPRTDFPPSVIPPNAVMVLEISM
ncbi:ribonuclease H-like domain-containing protein [Tanacetum coccineum]|uniref:Ribonuclease H-like domain-containing protein n=1 Tax=Tanacetum coccineum TaxID=301880 RepID=A0ABQ5IXD5_9ASTR